jgi:transposase-like protein
MPVAPPLIGTYTPPAVRVGERVICMLRDCECKVTSLSSAPLPWPRVQPLEHLGGSGLWVCDELVRAIKTESAAALGHHFGVSAGVVWRWRKAFGVGGRATTTGSKRAIRAAAQLGAEAIKAKEWTDDELDAKAQTAKRIGLRPPNRWTAARGGWTAEQVALLGTDQDDAIALKLGRSRGATTTQRVKRRIPAFSGWPGGGPVWMADEIALLGTDHDEAIAARAVGRGVP